MTALNSPPQLSLNWKAPKLHLLLLEWHNNYPSTQPANRISPSWRPQPIGYLNIWELICHSQQRPSHFFVSLEWVLLSSQISKDGFIIPTLCSTGTYETHTNIFRHLLPIQTTQQAFFSQAFNCAPLFPLYSSHTCRQWWLCSCVCVDCFPPLCSKRTNYGCLCSFNACKCQERNIAPLTT